MPPEKESHIEFNDDTIAKASAEAISLGKKSFEEQKNAFGTVQNSISDGTKQETEKENQPVVIKSLRTYQGDIAEAIKNQNASVLTIAMAEQQRVGEREDQKEKEEFKPRTILQRIKGEKPKPRTPTPEFVPPRIEPKPKQAPATFTPPPIFNVPPTQSVNVKPSRPEFPSKIVFGEAPQKKINDAFRRDTVTIAISILLILLGVGAVAGFYFLQKTPPKPAAAPASELTIIPYDTKETISTADLGRESLLQKLNAIRRGAPIADGSVHYVELTSGATSTIPISTNDLFSILNTNIPGNAIRAFGPNFMFGFYGINGNQPFILISLNSFENAYAGMLEWEKDMNTDVGAIFSPSAVALTQYVPINTPAVASTSGVKNVIATGTTAVTTIANLGPASDSQFGDVTIQNKDARVLKNSRAETILLYSFINQNTLLITSNESVLSAMIGKFTQQQYTR